MNRAIANNVIMRGLLAALFLIVTLCVVVAQTNRARPGAHAGNNNIPVTRATGIRKVYDTKLSQVPKEMMRGHYRGKGSRAPGDGAVGRQTQLITKRDPSLQNSSDPAPSQDAHPCITKDERYNYFDSDRADDSTIPQVSTGVFNIFRSFLDGSGVTQITTGTDNKIEPSVSQDGGLVAYAAGGNFLNLGTNLDNPSSAGFGLYYINLNTGGAPFSLSRNNPSGFTFADVRRPSWSSGGDKIVFAGKLVGQTAYHIFVVDVQTDTIRQFTSGSSNDYSPAWSPDGRLIAFTTNASAFAPSSAPSISTSLAANDDIYVLNPNPLNPDPARVTNLAINGVQTSNKNAAWSTLRPDPLGFVPPETNNNGDPISSLNLLAFASNRADTNHDGVANDIRSTFEIYWLHASVKPDIKAPGDFTVVTPESSGNPALKLRTSTPDTAIDPNDPSSMFDPNFVSNEDFPAWPQYISSYRIFFQSDRGITLAAPGNNLNIWASTVIDVNAPTLLKYDIANNEIIHVGREVPGNPSASNTSIREGTRGDTFRFRTRVVDYESGVESVYLQIKNPNSRPQSGDNAEHKVLFPTNPFLDAAIQAIQVPAELDSQAIAPGSLSYRPNGFQTNPQKKLFVPIPTNWPGWNRYIAGIDDLEALSGVTHPPDDDDHALPGQAGFWLRMWDDGPISKGGHEPEGETAGDGVYTNTWTSPAEYGSDWYLDLIVRDMAIDPFPPASNAVNWKIFDNVWGFTTQSFTDAVAVAGGNPKWLYVNDYDCGQRFFQTHFGSGTNAASFSSVPTETWMTEVDDALLPQTAINGTTIVPLANVLTTLGKNAYGGRGGFNTDPTIHTDASGLPVTESYVQWRILARGPLPDAVLNTFTPHIEVQPADLLAGGTGPRQVLVADKAIIWHSPYTGDLFVGPGTLLDVDTQVRLSNFVKKGGRMLMSGQDIAFGLTLSQGGAINPFLNQTMHVSFVADSFTFPNDNMMTWVTTGAPTARGNHPIAGESYFNLAEHSFPGTTIPNDPPFTKPLFIAPIPGTIRTYSAQNQASPDVVAFSGRTDLSPRGGISPSDNPDRSGVDLFYSSGTILTKPSVMWYVDQTVTPLISKVVFSPFGWEGITPDYFLAGTTVVLMNRRTEMTHNAGDWLRTGSIVGKVLDVSGVGPLKGVFVRAISGDPIKGPVTVATALTLGDGSYTLNGLDTDGIYTIDAFKKGFITFHGSAGFFHGGDFTRSDFFLTKAQPGQISGTITLATTGLPVAGVIVVAKSQTDANAPIGTATSDIQGKYVIQNLDADIYTVSTPLDPPGNLASLGYGGSIPIAYDNASLPGHKAAVTVTPAANITGIDFMLKQTPGRILGQITDKVTGLGIPGATVIATSAAGMFTATAGTDGTYIITGVDPNTYLVVASSPGYASNNPGLSVTVTSNQDTINANIALSPIPPGSLSGLVSTSAGIPVSGATITVTRQDGTLIATTTSGAVKTVGTYTFNYQFGVIPAGAKVIVTASKSGYTSRTGAQTVGPVISGQDLQGVNFTLDALHTFPSDLTLVSAPYEYSGVGTGNVGDLFGIPAADRASKAFAFIAWNPSPPGYIYYPTPPADTFHLGRGYFQQETNTAISLSLTTQGQPAPQDGTGHYLPFSIPLQTGWNLIGDPFPFSLNFLTLKIRDANGGITDVISAQSGANPSIGAALWTYEQGNYQVVFTMDAYRGYWIRAFRPVTLIVDPASQQGRAAVRTDSSTLLGGNGHGNGWKLQITATAGTSRSAPGLLGVHPAATNGYDAFKLESPPTVTDKNVNLTFDHSDWVSHAGKYSVDVRSAGTTSQKWDFTVASTIPNVPVVLNWPSLATVPGKNDITLTDLDTHTSMDVRTSSGYTIPAPQGGGTITRHFSLEVSRATRRTLQIMDVNARINGSGSRDIRSAEITYRVTTDASVQISILDRGRPIRKVDQGRSVPAGAGQTIWDLRNDRGDLVQSNTYLIEVRAQDKQGHVARVVTPLTITR